MKIDTNHLHHWMNAIRISEDPKRTLDAFWSGQIKSKEWLIEKSSEHIPAGSTIEIHGGWVGVLASMLFQTPSLTIKHIINVDIDPTCKSIAEEMNRIEHAAGKFISITDNMCDRYPDSNVIINTSCEHMTPEQYDIWLTRNIKDQLLILQSNDYNIPEHVRISMNLEEFIAQSKISRIIYHGQLKLPLYNRFMIIGFK